MNCYEGNLGGDCGGVKALKPEPTLKSKADSGDV